MKGTVKSAKVKLMFKILENLGSMKEHDAVNIYRLEDLGLVAVNFDHSDGTNMEAWKCNELGHVLDPKENSMSFKTVNEPINFNEDGEPEDFELVGFELN